MRIGRRGSKTTGLLVLALGLGAVASAAVQKVKGPAQTARLLSEYGKLPISFEENKGQTDGRVKFLSRGNGYALFLTPSEAVLSVVNRNAATPTAIRMQFNGANSAPVLEGRDVQPGKSNYIIGRNRNDWQLNASHYGKVAYRNLYRGIDLVYYGNQRELEYDFVVAPGANPKQISMKFEGVSSMRIENGELVLVTEAGALHQRRPVVYQDVNGTRQMIEGRYVIDGEAVRFDIARYDARKPLVIDPVLAWATYIGGNSMDTVTSIAVDSAGGAYVTGSTLSTNFPGQGSQRRGAEEDVFVTKILAAGNAVGYTTFLVGEKGERGADIAVNSQGEAIITGWTDSLTFPVSDLAMQQSLGGERDAFAAKLNPAGVLIWSTYIGGLAVDTANALALDTAGNPVIVGTTVSSNFWATTLQTAHFRPSSDGFVIKLNTNNGAGPVWSTYFGSTGSDELYGVAVGTDDTVYIAGRTNSIALTFPNGTIQRGIARVGTYDALVAKLAANGSSVVYWTYLGGTGFDSASDIAVDTTGAAYVYGYTDSANYPVLGALQATNAGNGDTFLTKLNPTGTARVYSTFLGGSGSDEANKIAVDSAGSAYLIGSTGSTNFPTADPFQALNNGARDATVAQVTPAGNGLVFSSYLGGVADDQGMGIALDSAANVYLSGVTGSFGYPTVGAAQPAFGGGLQDGFIAKLSNCAVALTPGSRSHTSFPENGTIAVTGASTCQWIATSNQPWLTIVGGNTGSGNGTISYTVAQNNSAPRTGTISVGGQQFTVTQAGVPIASGCVYPLEPNGIIAPGQGQLGTFNIPTTENCNWTASSNAPWLQVYPLNGTSTTAASYTVFPNFGTTIRNAVITVTNPGGVNQTFTVTQATPLLTEAQRFVTLAYFNFLGRYPTPAEIEFHTGSLNTISRASLMTNFFNSDEFAFGGRLVAALYVGLLNRNAEYGGWLFQRNALATGQVNQSQLVANFLNSAEFQTKYPGLTDAAFVSLLYQQILLRTASLDEINAQVQNIATSGRVAVATALLSSAEFRSKDAANARLNAFLLYATLLQRDPNPAEQLNRETQIATGTPVGALISDFIQSPEFLKQLQ